MLFAYKKADFLSNMVKGLQQIFQAPIINFFIVFVMTFNLFLSVGCYVLQKNINAMSNILNQGAEISLYLKKNVSAKLAANLAAQLKQNDKIMELRLITANEGIKNFTQQPEFGEIFLGFKKNPLPNVIVVYPKLNELTSEQLTTLIESLKNIHEVETVKTDPNWIENSHRLLSLWKHFSLILTLLSVGSILVFCCTIYMTPTIIINKTKSDRSLLLHQSLWLSLVAGLLAIALINFILIILSNFGFILLKLGTGYSIGFLLVEIFLGIAILKFVLRD